MKHKSIFSIFGVAVMVALLMAIIPVVPVLAYDYDVTISPTSGKIGDTITITGSDFNYSTDNVERYARIIFVLDDVSVGNIVGNLNTYKVIKDTQIGYLDDSDEGEFSTTFTVPSSLTDGDTDQNVAPGIYNICTAVVSPSVSAIRSVNTFTVLSAATALLTPTSGPAGTTVTITGSNFPATATIVIRFDSTAIPITTGDMVTQSGGSFISTITIPSGVTPGTHSIAVSAGTSSAPALPFTVTANAALDPISPASGPAGTTVAVSGSGFLANTALSIKIDNTPLTPTGGSTQTGSVGNFASIITIPSDTAAGAHIISVTVGTATVTQTFTVTAPPATTTTPPATTTTPPATTTTPPASTTTPTTPKPGNTTLTINKSGNNIGAAIGIGGSGFKKNGTITLKYDDKTVGTGTADASGFFVATFQVPPSKFGPHTISATDGTYTNTTTFEVEAVAPKTPQPLSPAMGVTIKSPLKFDWADATDNSTPVTYKLQIATATNFAADTIVIDKSGLATSEYTLSEIEELRLESNEGPLYWREKAIDGAQNESDWTGAGMFTAAQPFKFSGWPMILIIIVGAILMWLFGFWIGRKTAFYY